MQNLYKLISTVPLNEIEDAALKQIQHLLDLELVIKVVILPDVHAGYLAPIGSVILVQDHIVPEMVGYDIGCGMCHVNLGKDDRFNDGKFKSKLFDKLMNTIPHGMGVVNEKRHEVKLPFKSAIGDKELDKKVADIIGYQLGTLGSGNHFIELGVNLMGEVGVTIHSGSRHPGWMVGDYYMKLADQLYDKFLPLDSALGKAYIEDLSYMLNYALENRKVMLINILKVLGYKDYELMTIINDQMINENHNHACMYDYNDGIVLHRKGATPADLGQLGIIPGSMNTGVYVTKGRGNVEYLSSASHGAGRRMSRTKAKKQSDMSVFEAQMKGIVANVTKDNLDESPMAYKDIQHVLDLQVEAGIIDVVDHFKPLINIK